MSIGAAPRRRIRPPGSSRRPGALLAAACLASAAMAGLAWLSSREVARGDGGRDAAWHAHRERLRLVPEDAYRRDRFRSVRGVVVAEDGRPVSGVVVRSVRLVDLIGLAGSGMARGPGWAPRIEAAAETGPDGAYEFPHLEIGARTFFFSAPGRDLAPAIREMVAVQDGMGAKLDVVLGRPESLRVIGPGAGAAGRLALVPHRWWPEVAEPSPTPGGAEFRGLGGPFRRGLIVDRGKADSEPWRILGAFDLDLSSTATLETPAPGTAPRAVVPEAEGLPAWSSPTAPARRRFFAALSPLALLWPTSPDDNAFAEAVGDFLTAGEARPARGALRGFAPQGHMPVLIESRSGGAWSGMTSDASEYAFEGLPADAYRARSFDVYGRVTFAGAADVRPGASAKVVGGLPTRLDLAEPDSREVIGLVRWESGAPAAKAEVYMQHAGNFRRYLRRAEADENGVFRFVGVPGDEPYFAFALPAGEPSALRGFVHFGVESGRREHWLELTLHPHRVTSPAGKLKGSAAVELVRLGPGGDELVWASRADATGRATVANVPHGRYRLRSPAAGGGGRGPLGSIRSQGRSDGSRGDLAVITHARSGGVGAGVPARPDGRHSVS